MTDSGNPIGRILLRPGECHNAGVAAMLCAGSAGCRPRLLRRRGGAGTLREKGESGKEIGEPGQAISAASRAFTLGTFEGSAGCRPQLLGNLMGTRVASDSAKQMPSPTLRESSPLPACRARGNGGVVTERLADYSVERMSGALRCAS